MKATLAEENYGMKLYALILENLTNSRVGCLLGTKKNSINIRFDHEIW